MAARVEAGEQGGVVAAQAVDGGHALAVGVEGQLGLAGQGFVQDGLPVAHGGGRRHQGPLGGVAHGVVGAPFPFHQAGVVAEGAAHGGERQGGGRRGAGVAVRPDRPIPPHVLGEVEFVVGDVEHDDRHPVLGEGAGLVGADDGHRAQGLHRGQAADQGGPGQHALRPEGQGDGDHGRQAFGDDGHRHRDRGQQQVAYVVAPPQAQREDEGGDHQAGQGQVLAHPVEAALQRSGALSRLLEQAGDLAQFGAHAGGHHEGGAAALGHDGAHEGEVAAIPQRQARHVEGLRLLGYGLRLAGEGGLLDAEAGRLGQADVGGHQVPGLQQDHVAGHQVAGGDVPGQPGAHHGDLGDGQALQGGDGLLGLVLLEGAQQDEEHDDGPDGNGVLDVAEGGGEAGRGQQHQDHGGPDLVEEDAQRGPAGRALELVGPVALEAAGGFLRGEAAAPGRSPGGAPLRRRRAGARRLARCRGRWSWRQE